MNNRDPGANNAAPQWFTDAIAALQNQITDVQNQITGVQNQIADIQQKIGDVPVWVTAWLNNATAGPSGRLLDPRLDPAFSLQILHAPHPASRDILMSVFSGMFHYFTYIFVLTNLSISQRMIVSHQQQPLDLTHFQATLH